LLSIANVQAGAVLPNVPGVQHPIFDEMDSRGGGSRSSQDCVKVCKQKYTEKVKAGLVLTGVELLAWAYLAQREYEKCVSKCPSWNSKSFHAVFPKGIIAMVLSQKSNLIFEMIRPEYAIIYSE